MSLLINRINWQRVFLALIVKENERDNKAPLADGQLAQNKPRRWKGGDVDGDGPCLPKMYNVIVTATRQ